MTGDRGRRGGGREPVLPPVSPPARSPSPDGAAALFLSASRVAAEAAAFAAVSFFLCALAEEASLLMRCRASLFAGFTRLPRVFRSMVSLSSFFLLKRASSRSSRSIF